MEVKLLKPLVVIKETLERIGIANRKEKKIYPSCYAEQTVQGVANIFHFKEKLKVPKMEDIDVKRLNTIVWLLSKWNLIQLEKEQLDAVKANISEKKIFILSKQQKDEENWEAVHKYHGQEQTRRTV